MAAFGASLAEAMEKNFRDMTKAAAGEDAGAPRTPSRVLPSRLLGIDGDGIFVKAVLKLEPWERWRPRRRGLNETQERWFSLRTVRQSQKANLDKSDSLSALRASCASTYDALHKKQPQIAQLSQNNDGIGI